MIDVAFAMHDCPTTAERLIGRYAKQIGRKLVDSHPKAGAVCNDLPRLDHSDMQRARRVGFFAGMDR